MSLKVIRPVINFEKGRGHNNCQLIVYHCTGYPANTAEGIFRWFNNPASEKSSHDLILPNGDLWELVNTKDTSWGAGIVGMKNGIPDPPKNQIARKWWEKGGRINQIVHNIEILVVENKNPTEEQYKTAIERGKEIAKIWSIPIDSEHFCGHRDIRSDKLCPGLVSVPRIIIEANKPMLTDTPKVNNLTSQQKQSILNLLIAFIVDSAIIERIKKLFQ